MNMIKIKHKCDEYFNNNNRKKNNKITKNMVNAELLAVCFKNKTFPYLFINLIVNIT